MDQRYCILDYETRSEADLKKVGAYEYANHPSTQILCASWRVGTKEELRAQIINKIQPKVWSPAFPHTDKVSHLINILVDPSIRIIAHNAFFEQVITRFCLIRFGGKLIRDIPHSRWECTAAMAASLALPRNLEGACAALKLPIQKDMDGRRLILKYCKPRKPTKNNPVEWHSSARDLRRIMLYCQNDVDAETMLFLSIPQLNETERQVWLLDQKINFRGFKVDRGLVLKTLKMIDEETKILNKRTVELAKGDFTSTNQRAAVLKWLEKSETFLPDLKSKTVIDAIETKFATGDAKEMLEIRQAISKTSTAKYDAFEMRTRTDGRVRDHLVYHTASTGRWGGAGVQPQNFPRGNIKDTTLASEILNDGDLEWVRTLYGNPMNVFSSCLRSMIIAPKGRDLFCADYAAIEARVLFWIANHEEGLKAFREDRPMYEEMAMVIYGLSDLRKVTMDQRQVGKQALLGCGYGMGAKKFIQTCANSGIKIDEDVAQIAVKAYRSTHHPVVKLWSNLEKIAVSAIENPCKKLRINHTTWWTSTKATHQTNFLWCELPSGRRIAYYGPEIRYELTPWGDKKPVIYHWGVNPLSRKWTLAGTFGRRLCENVVQAVARDFMASAMLRIESRGYEVTLSVHDELLAERRIGEGSVEQFENLMALHPGWGVGCPIKVKGWTGPRYRK